MIKKIIYKLNILIFLLCAGCSTSNHVNDSVYLRCNETSRGTMAETEKGFYYVFDSILYYADKENMDFWTPVCNMPDCLHNRMNCNAYLSYSSGLAQKNGVLYGINVDATDGPYVYEVAQDGSGFKFVYDIPFEEGIFINQFRSMLSPKQLVMHYGYMTEDGMFCQGIGRLNNKKIEVLYTKETESQTSELTLSASSVKAVRGEEAIVSSLLAEDGEDYLNILWKINENSLERVNLPEDVSITGGYLEDEYFTVFKEGEGFYQFNLKTGEQVLISENHMEDSIGYVLTKDYMVEWNRYRGYTPEHAQLKFYNGEKWIDVVLPEEVKKSDNTFTVVSVASDRIFMAQSLYEANNDRSDLYYFMLEEDHPKLIYCDQVTKYGQEEIEISSEVESSEEIEDDFEDIIIADCEEYTFKITDMDLTNKQGCTLDVYWENKSSDKDYIFSAKYASVNGLQCNPQYGMIAFPGERNDKDNICFDFSLSEMRKFKLQDIYGVDEYTHIELQCAISDIEKGILEEKEIHIYPYGEENVIEFTRESQSTDDVLIDNEYATVLITGYEDGIVKNGNINIFLVNKTEEKAVFKIQNIFVNDVELKKIVPFYELMVNGGSSAYHVISFEQDSSFLKQNAITNIEKLEFHFKMFPANNSKRPVGEDFINEMFILNP